MEREIKFRVWDNVDYMSRPFTFQDVIERKIAFTNDCPVMQYTGLKDKNDKEIYEGDIIRIADSVNACIFFDAPTASFYSKSNDSRSQHLYGSNLCEIIGNIYQTPELLTN